MTAGILDILDSGSKDIPIHLVGVSGTEMSALCSYLINKKYRNLTLHDVSRDFTASFELAHRFYPNSIKKEYRETMGQAKTFHPAESYLQDIDQARFIFAPQSWFLYPQNDLLLQYREKLLFYTDICFDLFKGKIIGITGTVGKSSTALYTALLTGGLLSGNDRENILDLTRIENSSPGDILVFELSNRHLKNGISHMLDVGVLTNICPNHIPDHGSLEEYAAVKNSIFLHSRIPVFNARNPYSNLSINCPHCQTGFSFLYDKKTHADNHFHAAIINGTVQILDESVCSINELPMRYDHEYENFLAAALAARLSGISASTIKERIPLLDKKPKFRSQTDHDGTYTIINDAASCLPENTRRLTESLNMNFILITGGNRQAPLEDEFDSLAGSIARNRYCKKIFILGPMTNRISAALESKGFCNFTPANNLASAVQEAVKERRSSGIHTIVFSPGCGVGDEYSDKYERGFLFERFIRENK
ncbi:MAG: hypothetical protein GY754_11000 [bacterium]|nr:hypothetical protein [bacterium]